ncbi:MAG: hypothetical protein QOF51_2197, partial [Chloroflexota bacterium]|nr:hypothetical protein [Chloroflexota bacterium]
GVGVDERGARSSDVQEWLFPTHVRAGGLWLRTPVDDTRTWLVSVEPIADPDDAGVVRGASDPEIVFHSAAAEEPLEAGDASTEPVASPFGPELTVLLDLMRREIERVQQGLDPRGVIRDMDHAAIDPEPTRVE